jgi:hypothetical protein
MYNIQQGFLWRRRAQKPNEIIWLLFLTLWLLHPVNTVPVVFLGKAMSLPSRPKQGIPVYRIPGLGLNYHLIEKNCGSQRIKGKFCKKVDF